MGTTTYKKKELAAIRSRLVFVSFLALKILIVRNHKNENAHRHHPSRNDRCSELETANFGVGWVGICYNEVNVRKTQSYYVSHVAESFSQKTERYGTVKQNEVKNAISDPESRSA